MIVYQTWSGKTIKLLKTLFQNTLAYWNQSCYLLLYYLVFEGIKRIKILYLCRSRGRVFHEHSTPAT
jgi:hypothetical protein